MSRRQPKTEILDCRRLFVRIIVEYRQIEFADAFAIRDQVDLSDQSVPDRESEDVEQLSARSGDRPDRTVHERGLSRLRTTRDLLRKHSRSVRYAGRCRFSVVPNDNVRIESCHQRVEISPPCRCKERIDNLPLACKIRIGLPFPSLYAAAGPAGELSDCLLGSSDDRRNCPERHAENIVQHERHAFCRIQRAQYDEQRNADRIS